MSRTVALLDHGMGNMRSVAKALERAGASVRLTADRREIESAGALCVPGQGIFGRCMEAISGLEMGDFIREWIHSGRPFLGICLGMQVLFGSSEEGGGAPGLGVVPGKVVRLPGTVPVPHIGWNTVDGADRPLAPYFYFDHSYAPVLTRSDPGVAWCEHGIRFAAMIERDRLLGVQFHPEKSSNAGIELLRGWLEKV